MNSIIRFSILGLIIAGLLVVVYQYLEWASAQQLALQTYIAGEKPGSEAAVAYQITTFQAKTFPLQIGSITINTPFKLCPNWITDAWKPIKFQLIYDAMLIGAITQS